MKNKRYHPWRKTNLPLLAALLSANIYAQSEDVPANNETSIDSPIDALIEPPENWYQAEVILFTQDGNSRNEAPPKDYLLEFPENWLQLTDPKQEIVSDELSAQDNELGSLQTNPIASSISSPIPQASIPYLGEASEGLALEEWATEEPESADDNFAENAPEALYESFIPEYETPFVQLETPSRDLNESASALDRRGYGVLFHEAWRFQITGSDTAPWIVIKAGATDTSRYQLEGSIRFYQSRFLHFETNLWRLKFTDSQTIPLTLPDLPVLDTPDITDLTLLSEGSVPDVLPQLEPTLQTFDDNSGLSQSIDFLPQNTFVDEVNETNINNTNNINIDNLELPSLENSTVTQFENPDNAGSETSPVIPEYPIEAVWVMEKSQRLQEAEVYYLDHPEMGVLVTIKSYEPELLNPPKDSETANEFIDDLRGESNPL
jgi:hypothetical protein